MALADKGTLFKRGNTQATAHYPQLWCRIDGRTALPLLASIGIAVFSLFANSAGNERGFKVCFRVHYKERNRMGNEQLDKQSFVGYNEAQLNPINTIINVPSKTLMDRALFESMGNGERIFLVEKFRVHVDDPLANLAVIDNNKSAMDEVEDRTDVCALLLADVTKGFGHFLLHYPWKRTSNWRLVDFRIDHQLSDGGDQYM